MSFYAGASRLHGNAISFGDINNLDNPAAYSVACWFCSLDSATDATLFISKRNAGANPGWYLVVDAEGRISVNHRDGAAATGVEAVMDPLTDGVWTHIALSWDGSNASFYIDGVASGTPAFTRVPAANAVPFTLMNGSDPASNFGTAGHIAHVFWWDTALSTQEMVSVYAGMVPQLDNLKFWHQCWDKSQRSFRSQYAITITGTVTETEFGGVGVPNPGLVDNDTLPPAYLWKIINETETLTHAVSPFFFILVADTETMEDEEGYSPWGYTTETMSDGTVWTKIPHPFLRRFTWTEESGNATTWTEETGNATTWTEV